MKLQLCEFEYYRVKRGQNLLSIAEAFFVPPRFLAVYNDLDDEPQAGRILKIPKQSGNLYVVKGGESKTLLCGSPENFEEKNKTTLLYPGQVVVL